jgi:hypothetical protein
LLPSPPGQRKQSRTRLPDGLDCARRICTPLPPSPPACGPVAVANGLDCARRICTPSPYSPPARGPVSVTRWIGLRAQLLHVPLPRSVRGSRLAAAPGQHRKGFEAAAQLVPGLALPRRRLGNLHERLTPPRFAVLPRACRWPFRRAAADVGIAAARPRCRFVRTGSRSAHSAGHWPLPQWPDPSRFDHGSSPSKPAKATAETARRSR